MLISISVYKNSTSFPGSTLLSRWRGGEDPGTHRYDTHADWSEDIDILTLVVIGRNCLSCKMADLCSYIAISCAIETKLSPVKHSSCCFNYSRQLKEELKLMLDRKLT